MEPSVVAGGSLLEVQTYGFEFSLPQGFSGWFSQTVPLVVPPGGNRWVASVANWHLNFGSETNKLSSLGVSGYVDSNAYPPQVGASVIVSAFDPANPTAEAANAWSGWVSVQVLVFA